MKYLILPLLLLLTSCVVTVQDPKRIVALEQANLALAQENEVLKYYFGACVQAYKGLNQKCPSL